MEIKVLNENTTVKNIFVKDNDNWIKFETTGSNNKSKLYDGVSFKNYKGTTFDVSVYNVSNMTDMTEMFYYCYNLTSLDLSSFDTSNVTDMNGMFSYCSSLTSLDLSSFDTSKVTKMYCMFQNCSGLTSDKNIIGLNNFDTSNVENMNNMFSVCRNLVTLDVSNFDLTSVTAITSMFVNCDNLENIKINNLGINEKSDIINISKSPKLLKDSMLYIFNNAFDRSTAGYSTFKIQLHESAKALLSNEEIAIATNKGFTIA